MPGYEFDLIPPTLTGARNVVVRAPNRSKRVRVRYSVTAMDAVDGLLSSYCAPRSGRFFKLGRTNVTCSAIDSSANTAAASFKVTVKH